MTQTRPPPSPIEWNSLWWPLLGLLACLLLGAGLIVWSKEFRQAGRLAVENHSQELENAQKLYEEAGATLKTIRDYHPGFQALQARGFFGEEQRLNWINQLHRLQERINLFNLRYQIEAQKPYVLPAINTAPGFQLYQSAMQLELGLLHEEDLFKLLGELAKPDFAGLFSVNNCVLRLQQHQLKNPQQSNITAKCTLFWYTATASKAPVSRPP